MLVKPRIVAWQPLTSHKTLFGLHGKSGGTGAGSVSLGLVVDGSIGLLL
jgi:hypothetical protein